MQKGMPNLLAKAYSAILGPIPVLSTEDAKHYNVMWKNSHPILQTPESYGASLNPTGAG